MKEEESLRTAFDAMAQRYSADPLQGKMQEQLSTILSVVSAFQAEGFPVTLETRPEHDRCAVEFTDKTRMRIPYANGTIKAGDIPLQFALGRKPYSQELGFIVTWGNAAVMQRVARLKEDDQTWSDEAGPLYPHSGMDGETQKSMTEGSFREALSALVMHVLVKKDLVLRFNSDAVTLDKPASLPLPARLKAPPAA